MTREALAKTVMLYATVDTFDIERGPAAFSMRFCETANAGLTAFLLNLDANAPPSRESRSLEQLRAESDLREVRNATNVEVLLGRAAQSGIDAVAMTAIDHSRGMIGCVADHARLHDLVIIGTDSRGMLSDRIIAENLLFEIGRPLIVVPPNYLAEFACHRIAAAWDNSRVAARALGDALALLPGIEEIVLLTVGGEKAILSSIDHDAMVRMLERRGVSARVERRDLNGRSIGEAIQDDALDVGANLLVMGGYGHSRLREFILGGATLSVFANPQLPILMSH
ncbi:universal stress protein [Novosphingobium pentaromativorans]|uniref:UspA n=1 Tax=Novosphingobium pentaromativorans US6-1 TaxID=1088721 RepID=G6E6W6_9SPHN|nr:universal stress protein [Novosphingobium pentaromativorans]AIT78393.1 universal stress protein UspA [Novosphingobium pentaromativorans US6-1]EHJ63012.1 UspA [Novosphingobium pentaromativorans US6-1]